MFSNPEKESENEESDSSTEIPTTFPTTTPVFTTTDKTTMLPVMATRLDESGQMTTIPPLETTVISNQDHDFFVDLGTVRFHITLALSADDMTPGVGVILNTRGRRHALSMTLFGPPRCLIIHNQISEMKRS